MFRKYLFGALLLILVIVIVSLIVGGQRAEKQSSSKIVEVVKESKPSQTRVLTPQDLEIVQAAMKLQEKRTARHTVEIRNNGSVPYNNIALRFTYLDGSGKTVSSTMHMIAKTALPGSSIQIDDIAINDIPASTASSKTKIAYADIGQN